jgi:Heterokaryon incompatibility protein (HET)
MRLIHSEHLTFKSFMEYQSIPKYAILSHTWQDDEITYRDMVECSNEVVLKRGYRKIKACAQQAVKDGLDYFWVDTCCIDKSSSAELSEAINSMFRWYRNADVCYAYLYDIPARFPNTHRRTWTAKFQTSRWFTRGWTLQELIAPRCLEFYSEDWSHIGTKEDLTSAITDRTGIPYEVVISSDFSKASLAQRMSWAAGRSTSRREDAAYCLMGLFDVSM